MIDGIVSLLRQIPGEIEDIGPPFHTTPFPNEYFSYLSQKGRDTLSAEIDKADSVYLDKLREKKGKQTAAKRTNAKKQHFIHRDYELGVIKGTTAAAEKSKAERIAAAEAEAQREEAERIAAAEAEAQAKSEVVITNAITGENTHVSQKNLNRRGLGFLTTKPQHLIMGIMINTGVSCSPLPNLTNTPI